MKKCPVCGSATASNGFVCNVCGAQLGSKNSASNNTVIKIGTVMIVLVSLVSGLMLSNLRTQEKKKEIQTHSEVNSFDDIQPDAVKRPEIDNALIVQTGIKEYENGNFDGAVTIFSEALERDLKGDTLFDVYFYLADSYYSKEMYDDAIINFHKALEEKYDYVATVYLAQTYFLVDDNKSAEHYFDEAFRMDDERGEAYVFYSEFLYYSGNLSEAEKNALIAYEKMPENIYSAELLVYINFDQDNTTQMEKYYQILADNNYEYLERVTEYISQIKS